MKSFSNFIKEAVSLASQQAQKMGLTGDGHGDWYDREGNLIAKTVKGRLKIFDRKKKKSEEPQQQQQKPKEVEDDSKKETSDTLTVGFGRFNPPTTGHEKLLNHIKNVAAGGQYEIYPSHSQDAKKNPLDSKTKVDFMRKMYPKHSENIVYNKQMKTIFDVLKGANAKGVKRITIVVGADRLQEFEKLSNKYNGKEYEFDQINVVSAGERDPDAEGLEGMSASKLRQAAIDGDYETFSGGMPKALGPSESKKLYNTIRKNMNVGEDFGVWEIAPKLDWKNLRENYVNGNIFKIDQIVENLNTGIVGKIIRNGTNYVICVTEAGEMFKSWIHDIGEVYEFGTDEYRKYVQKITPNQPIRDFINKNKKSIATKKKNARPLE